MGDRGADRVHATDILANPGQRATERRMDEAARQPPAHEQHDEAIGIGGAAEQVEAEEAENRPDLHALQPVVTAGD